MKQKSLEFGLPVTLTALIMIILFDTEIINPVTAQFAQYPHNFGAPDAGFDENALNKIRLCVYGTNALLKCQAMSRAMNARGFKPNLACVEAISEYECMEKIENYEADVVNLDSGLVYTAGIYYSMIPILAESYGPESNYQPTYKTVAVVRSGLNIKSLADLRGLKSCHTGIGTSAGWIIPLGVLYQQQLIPSNDCNNPVIAIAKFFNESCAPNALIRQNNLGFNPSRVCNLCKNNGRNYCTTTDSYAGEAGAFECLREGGGDIAFVRDLTPIKMTTDSRTSNFNSFPVGNVLHNPFLNYGRSQDFSLLCLNGEKKPLSEYETCNWGYVPGNAMMILSSKLRYKDIFKQFFINASKVLGIERQPSPFDDTQFEMFNSKAFAGHNLIFSDTTQKLIDVGDRNSYQSYLGDYVKVIEEMSRCDIEPALWCVISRSEMDKCLRLKAAFAAKTLLNGVDVGCVEAKTKRDCMRMIDAGVATLSLFEAGDIYTAGKHYNMITILAEEYGLGVPAFHAVAVKLTTNPNTNLLHMRNTKTCHTAYNDGAGWYAPIGHLLASGQMRVLNGQRDSGSYVSEFFQSSCAPGALNEKSWDGKNKDNLCRLCIGTGDNFCQKNDGEPYYGDSGALRCLHERRGQVAFVRHTTVWDNAENRNHQSWARTTHANDFQLLCADGSIEPIDKWNMCNLGIIPSDAIMISKRKTPKEIEAYIRLVLRAQEYFGRKDEETIYYPGSMSGAQHQKNHLLNDATVKLFVIPEKQRTYENYLGPQFLRLVETVGSSGTTIYINLKFFIFLSITPAIILLILFSNSAFYF